MSPPSSSLGNPAAIPPRHLDEDNLPMNQTSNPPASPTPAPLPASSKLGQRLFLGFLGCVACLYAVIVVYHLMTINQPKTVPFAQEMGFMEECRQVCLKYGLLTTGHVKNDARAYLQKVGKE